MRPNTGKSTGRRRRKKSRNGRKTTRNKTIYELIPRYFIKIYDRVADAFAYMRVYCISLSLPRSRRRPEPAFAKERGQVCTTRAPRQSILDKKSPTQAHTHVSTSASFVKFHFFILQTRPVTSPVHPSFSQTIIYSQTRPWNSTFDRISFCKKYSVCLQPPPLLSSAVVQDWFVHIKFRHFPHELAYTRHINHIQLRLRTEKKTAPFNNRIIHILRTATGDIYAYPMEQDERKMSNWLVR